MPTYQYACTTCDHAFEAVQSFSDDSLTVCPECSGALRKVFSAVGVVFKGSGFYKTDSRSGSSSSSSGSSSSAKSSSDAASSTGSDNSSASTSSSTAGGSTSASSTSTSTPSATPAASS